MKEKLTFLGIETSCDETAASVVQEKTDGPGNILSNVLGTPIGPICQRTKMLNLFINAIFRRDTL